MSTDLANVRWFKSSYSSGGQECVEIAFFGRGQVGVRDSKDPAGPALVFAGDVWDDFTAGLIAGRFE